MVLQSDCPFVLLSSMPMTSFYPYADKIKNLQSWGPELERLGGQISLCASTELAHLMRPKPSTPAAHRSPPRPWPSSSGQNRWPRAWAVTL